MLQTPICFYKLDLKKGSSIATENTYTNLLCQGDKGNSLITESNNMCQFGDEVSGTLAAIALGMVAAQLAL